MRYIVGILIVVGLIFVGILLLVKLIFGGSEPETQSKDNLVDSATTSQTVQMTIQGPINSNDEHQQIKIEVSNTQTRLELIDGYEDQAAKTSLFTNNTTSYATFLRALDLLGYTNGVDDKALADERGYCPSGQRYIFEINDGSEQIQRYWASSCNNPSNFEGATTDIVNLFRAQIPDYNEATRGYSL